MVKANTPGVVATIKRQFGEIKQACFHPVFGRDPAIHRKPSKCPVQRCKKADVMIPSEDPHRPAVMRNSTAVANALDGPKFPRVDRLVDKSHEGGVQGAVEIPAAGSAQI